MGLAKMHVITPDDGPDDDAGAGAMQPRPEELLHPLIGGLIVFPSRKVFRETEHVESLALGQVVSVLVTLPVAELLHQALHDLVFIGIFQSRHYRES